MFYLGASSKWKIHLHLAFHREETHENVSQFICLYIYVQRKIPLMLKLGLRFHFLSAFCLDM
ncbi:CLUMA_CG021446, isoform A [Clunio marinus]|uniref:CLUMA_CG021446, isoform A n=1 Tax=Clunio marinus TaxID=568069 RepID=A0A1J1J820_9DIPT|nr:CLUMA_CG021446, isoform A [Clunio marinus]